MSAHGQSRHAAAAFLTAFGLLAGSALTLRWATARLHLFLSKQPVPLRRAFTTIPSRLGPYSLETEYPRLSAEAEGALRAQAYLTRVYRDLRLPAEASGARLRLHLAYYTGTPDTVIHVPEICYVAAGATGRDLEQARVQLEPAGAARTADGRWRVRDAASAAVILPTLEVPMRLFHFGRPHRDGAGVVAYFFVANGSLVGMPEGVRALALDFRDRYAYWCKVEVLPHGLERRDEVVTAVSGFLAAVLPEIMGCLPDWDAVRGAGTVTAEGE